MDAFDLRDWTGFCAAGGNPSRPASIDGVMIDSRLRVGQQALFVALKGQRENGHLHLREAIQNGAAYLLVQKEWKLESPFEGITLLYVESTIEALQEIAKVYRKRLQARIIAITGAFGKTLVKNLLLDLLATSYRAKASPGSFNSQVGVPLALLRFSQADQICIVEAAISKKGEMDRLRSMIAPHDVLVSPCGKKHLDTLHSVEESYSEYVSLAQDVKPPGWVLLPSFLMEKNRGDPAEWVASWEILSGSLPHVFATPHLQGISEEILFPDGAYFRGSISTGNPYALNTMNMAIKAAWLLGISSEAICSVLKNYQWEPVRSEVCCLAKETIVVNESGISSPYVLQDRLREMQEIGKGRKTIFVFGGFKEKECMGKDPASVLQRFLVKYPVDQLCFIGSHSYSMFNTLLEEMIPGMSIKKYSGLQELFQEWKYDLGPLEGNSILFHLPQKVQFEKILEGVCQGVHYNECRINLAAIRANLKALRQKLAPGTRMMVMIKACAYGMDAVRMAYFLARWGVDLFGVSYVDEGVALRQAGVKQSIFVLHATSKDLERVIHYHLEIGVSDRETILCANQYAVKANHVMKLHLHIDTGMGRFGCRPEIASELVELIEALPGVSLEGVMTHFACADAPSEDPFTEKQINRFDEALSFIRKKGIDIPWVHASNSSAAIRLSLHQYNMVRLGLSIYGLYPSEAVRHQIDLQLAISLFSRIVAINICRHGENVSYGRHYTASRDEERIAVLPLGYFDGLHRSYSSKGSVWVRGKRAPLVGKICMDYMMIDVTDIPDAQIGDKVLVFGEDPWGCEQWPEQFAEEGSSTAYELITCLGPRIPRVFVDEEHQRVR